MTSTAEAYGFGARMPYAQPRPSEYEMKERVRLSGLFPRVRNEPLSNQLQALMKEFDKNAALTGILERRRRLEERQQFELKGKEGMDALNRDLAPAFREGLANAATSASVADRLVRSKEADQQEQAEAALRPAPDAADVMTGMLTREQQRDMIFNEGFKKGQKNVSDKISKDKKKQQLKEAAEAQQGKTQVGGSVSSNDPLPGTGGAKAKARQRNPATPRANPVTPGTAAPGTAKSNRQQSRSKSAGRPR